MDETAARAVLAKRLLDMSQKDIADSAGVSAQYISDVVNRRRNIGHRLAVWLGFRAQLVKSK